MQFENPANPAMYMRTAAAEIIERIGGDLNALACGIVRAGTFTGARRALKEKTKIFKEFE